MAGIKHFTVQKYYELETEAGEKNCFWIYLFMKVVLIKPKPLVHEGGTNSPGLSFWAAFCPHMWTQQLCTWHIGIIRCLVSTPIVMTHCALPYWSGGLSSKWQLGIFSCLASVPLFLLPMPSESSRSHKGSVRQWYLPSSVISGYVRKHQIQLL